MHVIESLEFGGAEKVVVHLANRLSEDNTVSICLTKRKGELLEELNNNINVYCLHSPEGNNFSLPQQIRDLINNHKVDILHSHDWGVYLESVLAVKKSKNTAMVHTVHGPYMSYPQGIKSSIKIWLRHLLEKKLSKHVCKIVSVSNSIKDYISQDIGIKLNKLQTIHNGINDISDNNLAKNNNDIVRFVTTGRLAKIKNHALMIMAIKKVIDKNPNIKLTIIGDGPEREAIEKAIADLQLENYIELLGFRTDVKELLKQHDVFLMSSEYEGISIALLEAMSLSMPAIATRVGGIPETIMHNKTGLLVSSGDVEGYTNAILQIIEKPERIEGMGKQARELFLKEYHEDVVLEQYRSLYKQCLDF